jgi:hypothetical protein
MTRAALMISRARHAFSFAEKLNPDARENV